MCRTRRFRQESSLSLSLSLSLFFFVSLIQTFSLNRTVFCCRLAFVDVFCLVHFLVYCITVVVDSLLFFSFVLYRRKETKSWRKFIHVFIIRFSAVLLVVIWTFFLLHFFSSCFSFFISACWWYHVEEKRQELHFIHLEGKVAGQSVFPTHFVLLLLLLEWLFFRFLADWGKVEEETHWSRNVATVQRFCASTIAKEKS